MERCSRILKILCSFVFDQFLVVTTAVVHHQPGIIDLLGLPAFLVAEVMLIMRGIRVLLIYYPETRKKWKNPNEKQIIRVVVSAYVLMEIIVWSAAAVYGIPW